MASFPTVVNRNVQYPARVKLTDINSGLEATYDVEQVPGTVAAAGTPINKALFDAIYAAMLNPSFSVSFTAGNLKIGVKPISNFITAGSNGSSLVEKVYSDGTKQKIFTFQVSDLDLTTSSQGEYFASVDVPIPTGSGAFTGILYPDVQYLTQSTGLIRVMLNSISPTAIQVLLINNQSLTGVNGVLYFNVWGN
jgi:hypothetical protein